MAQRNDQVLDRVRQMLNRQPELGSRMVFEKVKDMDETVAASTLAQFHARYVLPIKREQAAARAGQGSGKRAAGRRAARPRATGGQAARTEQREEAPPEEAPRTIRRRRRSRQESTAPGAREEVRAVILDFVKEFSQAESRTEIVEVLSKVDEYVNRIVQRQG